MLDNFTLMHLVGQKLNFNNYFYAIQFDYKGKMYKTFQLKQLSIEIAEKLKIIF